MPDPNETETEPDAATEPQDGASETDAAIEPQDEPTEPVDRKQHNQTAFELRKAREELDKKNKELERFRAEKKEQQRTAMTETQQLKADLEESRLETQRLQRERLQSKIGAEFKLPGDVADLLQGDDEDAMRAHAEKLSKHVLRPRVGTPTDPARESAPGKGRIYKRSELRDMKFFEAHKDDIMRAQKEGRITEG